MQSTTNEQNEEIIKNTEIRKQSPLDSFKYALKSSEARRKYPKRLKKLFDFLGLPGSLGEQATEFLKSARQNAQWCPDTIIAFLDFHNLRVKRKELAAGTLKNYYRAAKLFCQMNDLTTTNWNKIPIVREKQQHKHPSILFILSRVPQKAHTFVKKR